ncbi:O-antigen ligase [Gulbenkiania indica]|uniref:O-antigen ligase n=1 Tax=Gulbenkiania indica TaxID=375574 RepID=A0A0K6GT73_9NEIS|nr:O-antigen ligase family protein [Gulbenkiania indica]CUA81832.1 O-antigen ligase [Gulbenkiania indica]
MQRSLLAEKKWSQQQLALNGLLLFFFAQFSSALTAVAQISFWGTALIGAYVFVRVRPAHSSLVPRRPLVVSFVLLVAVLLVSGFVNPEWWSNNLAEFRKDHLRLFLLFPLAFWVCRDYSDVRRLLMAAVAGFTLRALLVLGFYLSDWAVLESYRKGFALDAIYCFSAGLLLFLFDRGLSRRSRILLGAALAVQVVPLLLHGSRSPLLVILLAVGLAVVAARRWRLLLTGALALLIVLTGLVFSRPQLLLRYETVLQGETYTQDFSVVERQGIWWVTLQLVERQPWLGYGPGWRKLSPLALESGLMDEAKQHPDRVRQLAYGYFAGRATYGKANPHNLYLNWLLEAGFLGLFAYLGFIVSLFRASWHARLQPGGQMWWLLALGLVTCQLASGITNGLWPAGWLLILVAGALARKENETTYPS